MKEQSIILSGEVGWEITVDNLNTAFEGFDKSQHVEIGINTFGGDVFEGLAIYNYLMAKRNDGWQINTLALGLVASAGTIIYLAGKERKAYDGAQFLIHQVQAGQWGKAEDLKKTAEEVAKLDDTLVGLYEKTLNLTAEEVRALMAEDTFIDVSDAAEIGLVTEVIELEAVAQLIKRNMSILNKIRNKFRNAELEVTLADGTTVVVQSESDAPAVGDAIMDANGKPLPDGEYTTQDGKVFVVQDGKIVDIQEPSTEGGNEGGDEAVAQIQEQVNELTEAVEVIADAIADLRKEFVNLRRNVKSAAAKVDAFQNKLPAGNGGKTKLSEVTARLKEQLKNREK